MAWASVAVLLNIYIPWGWCWLILPISFILWITPPSSYCKGTGAVGEAWELRTGPMKGAWVLHLECSLNELEVREGFEGGSGWHTRIPGTAGIPVLCLGGSRICLGCQEGRKRKGGREVLSSPPTELGLPFAERVTAFQQSWLTNSAAPWTKPSVCAARCKSQEGIESSDGFVVLWSDGHFSAIYVTLLDLFCIQFVPVSSLARAILQTKLLVNT